MVRPTYREECREITERVGAKRLIELVANPALTGFTLPKIWWVRKHEAELWLRVRSIMLPKDYVRFKLTGGGLQTWPMRRGRCCLM